MISGNHSHDAKVQSVSDTSTCSTFLGQQRISSSLFCAESIPVSAGCTLPLLYLKDSIRWQVPYLACWPGICAIVVEAKQTAIDRLHIFLQLPPFSCLQNPSTACRGAILGARGMAAGRAEVDTSRAFRSVKEAVAVFGERILARETQSRPSATVHGDRFNKPRSNSVAFAVPNTKLEVSDDGVTMASGILTRESHSMASATYSVNQEETANNSAPNPPVQVTRPVVQDDVPMYLVPSSPPFFASSPSLANDDFDEQERKNEADLMVLSSIKKLEEEAARARQDVAQLKKRIAEMELSMATLNAKLHRALSKLAHMEADKAAAERASIERGRSDVAALALWAEQHRRRAPARSGRPPLGHLMRFGDGDAGDGEVAMVAGGSGQQEMVARPVLRRKVQKRKPIVPLVLPMINGLLFSNKKRAKDKESVYMKELYSLLRLS